MSSAVYASENDITENTLLACVCVWKIPTAARKNINLNSKNVDQKIWTLRFVSIKTKSTVWHMTQGLPVTWPESMPLDLVLTVCNL